MKQFFFFTFLAFILFSCTNKKKILIFKEAENWSSSDSLVPPVIRHDYTGFLSGSDTLLYISNYYPNGKLKSKVVLKNSCIWKIRTVRDTLGKPLYFGHFKNGTGYVIQYTEDTGIRESKGKFVNGVKEGWWKRYHYLGSVLDSTFYINGYAQLPKSTDALDQLLDVLGPINESYYF